MNDQVLTILKGCLLALLYLFLLRVVLIVSRELRGTPAVAPPRPVPASAPPTTQAPPPRKKAFTLVVREPPTRRGETLEVRSEITIGRGGGCALALPDDTFASNLHARAFVNDNHLFIEDLGSTNGTVVNRARIDAPTRLRKGDRVVVGQTVLEVDG